MIESDIVSGPAVESALKLTCSREQLNQALGIVSRGVSTRTAVLVLSGILLRAEGGRLHLAATDMELSLRGSVEAQVAADGSVVVSGRKLLDVVRALPAAEVSIEHLPGEGVVQIVSGSASFRLHTFSTEDFPRLPEIETAQLHPVGKEALLDTISRVQRAASRDESRPVLTGILVRFEGGTIVMAATDSYRMSVKETAVEGQLPELEAIIPARALAELSRVAASVEEIQLGVHENHVVFGADGTWLTTRRIDGQFPNYRQLRPEAFEHEVPVARDELADVVRRVSLMAERNSPLRLRFADGELTVSSQTQDVGEAKESLPVQFSGEPLEIGFNADFLRDGIESVVGEQAVLKLISPLRPGLVTGEGDDFWYLIMPIRLAG
ncbi:MAG TPA: DNA polymerase III subunit beta [Gaiellaceae bacterium]|jgi:DNA polymerase-3 subunit beta|nr:DNA polymerase III subunit beta [Gaiellaceae bacterium]